MSIIFWTLKTLLPSLERGSCLDLRGISWLIDLAAWLMIWGLSSTSVMGFEIARSGTLRVYDSILRVASSWFLCCRSLGKLFWRAEFDLLPGWTRRLISFFVKIGCLWLLPEDPSSGRLSNFFLFSLNKMWFSLDCIRSSIFVFGFKFWQDFEACTILGCTDSIVGSIQCYLDCLYGLLFLNFSLKIGLIKS